MQDQLIKTQTKNVLYWIEKAITDLKNGESAVYSLLTAVNHASSLEIYKTQADERDIDVDYDKVFTLAQDLAKKEIEEED